MSQGPRAAEAAETQEVDAPTGIEDEAEDGCVTGNSGTGDGTDEPPEGPTSQKDTAVDHADQPWWSRTWVVVAGLTTLIAVIPLGLALAGLRSPRWFPMLDLAQTEMRVRDVATGDRPLIGLPGRFDINTPGPDGSMPWQGSHPGPLSFYALWPIYTLFGASAWALQVAAAGLNIAASGIAIWIGKRRGGLALAIGVATVLVLLARLYGFDKLTTAWNPYMPMLWWVVFVLAVWSVLADDLPMLPVAVFAGSLCMQTHIPYLGLIAGGAGLAVLVAVGVAWLRRRREGTAFAAVGGGRRVAAWVLASLALLVVLWAPPAYQQITREPGNVTVVRASLVHEEAPGAAVDEVLSVWLGHLDVRRVVDPPTTGTEPSREIGPGLVLLAVWAAAAAVSLRRWRSGQAPGQLVSLHAVVGVALALGAVSISQITGSLWYYLMLWAWGTTALVLLAVGWSVANLLATDRSRRIGLSAVGGVLVVGAVLFAATAWRAELGPTEHQSPMVEAVALPLADALRSGDLPGGGEDGRYLAWWSFTEGTDQLTIGSQAYGGFLELERQGFDIGAPPHHSAGVGTHRAYEPDDVDAIVHHVVGPCIIQRWHATEEAELAVEADLRSPAEVARFEELKAEVREELEAAGEGRLGAMLDQNIFAVKAAHELPEHLLPQMEELESIGLPAAAFVTPPSVTHPTAPSCD